MEFNKKLEVFGVLLKQETLFPVEEKIVSGSLVLESLDPFPGYYLDTPHSSPPVYLYLALDKMYRLEEIIRTSQSVEPLFEHPIDAAKAIVYLGPDEIPVIRLRHFGNYDILAPLQEALCEAGIGYLRWNRKHEKCTSLVKIVKIMWIKQVESSVYIDMKEDFHGYIEIPRFLTWEQFKLVTRQVKYNWFGSKFDAAVGSFVLDGRLREFVRIYSTRLDARYLQDIRSLYLEKLSHPL